MDTTPQPLAPDLQTSLRHLRRIVLGGAAALVLLAGAAGYAAPAQAAGTSPNTGAGGGKVSMQRHVNEYEGQHRLVGYGKDPEFPVTPNLVSGKDPEIPSTPGLAGGKDPEIPVTTG